MEITVRLGPSYVEGQRWASVMLGDVPLFTELVYDVKDRPAEKNILTLFGERLRRLTESS